MIMAWKASVVLKKSWKAPDIESILQQKPVLFSQVKNGNLTYIMDFSS